MNKETTVQNGDSQVSKAVGTSQRLGCLHRSDRCSSSCSDSFSVKEVPLFHFPLSGLPVHGTTIRNVPKPWIFTKLMDVIAAHLHQLFISLFPYLDNWLIRDLICGRTCIAHNILPPNSSKSRIHSKSKKVRFESSSAFHLCRDGISDTPEYSQSTSRPYRIHTSDNQTISNLDSSFSMNLPFSFVQTHCCSRLSCSRQTSFTTATNVSVVGLETSYFPTGSSSSDYQYDPISFEMADGHQLLRSGNIHPSSRSQCIPFYGCLPLWMGELISNLLSWLLDRRPIPAPYPHSRNNGHWFCTEESHTLHTPLSTDNTTIVSYINNQGGTHSPNLCIEVWEILYWCLEHDIILRIHHIPGKFNIQADCLLRLAKPLSTEWSLD